MEAWKRLPTTDDPRPWRRLACAVLLGGALGAYEKDPDDVAWVQSDTARNLADLVVDTSHFNVHELRNFISDHFRKSAEQRSMLISCISFGYRYGIPPDSDLVFDVRFLPNPNYIPQFHDLTGKDPKVARYIRSFPQTDEFNQHISELLAYLIPHYVREGKSYLTIAFGCTGGRHRSVMMAEEVRKALARRGFSAKVVHRDMDRSVA